jgi:fructose-1,6-bisphosphatase/inositol monophosphatase family enzyme
MSIDPDRVSKIIEEIAQEEVLPRFRALADEDVQTKMGGELVTTADHAAEDALTRRLGALLPGSLVVGEEAVAADPRVMARLDGDDPVWVIDPVDGTGNFAGGKPAFAVMVALIVGGKTQGGWIHDPVAGRTAAAEAGSGAFMAGRRLGVAKAAPVAEMTGTLHASSYAPKKVAARVQAGRNKVAALPSKRCAGLEYLQLVTGEMSFTLFTRLMPWDHAPGILLHSEAGGYNACFDGTPYGARRYREIGVLMAPDRAAWAQLHEVLLRA